MHTTQTSQIHAQCTMCARKPELICVQCAMCIDAPYEYGIIWSMKTGTVMG